jgi:WD40 repeat protein
VLFWAYSGPTLYEWDTATGERVADYQYKSTVKGAAWKLDGSQILAFLQDATGPVINTSSGKTLFTVAHEPGPREDDPVRGAAWSPDETRVLTWADDGTVREWDAATGDPLLPLDEPTANAFWLGTGDRFLTQSDTTVSCWEAETGNRLFQLDLDEQAGGIRLNTGQTQILTWAGMSVQIWDMADGTLLHTMSLTGNVKDAVWNPSETQVAAFAWDDSAAVWEAASGDLLFPLIHELDPVENIISSSAGINSIMWDQQEKYIVSFASDGRVRIWDAHSGELLLNLYHGSDLTLVLGGVFNSDESKLMTWTGSSIIHVWEMTTGQKLLTLDHQATGSGYGGVSAAWTQDESMILTSGRDGTVRLWDAQTGKSLLTLRHPEYSYLGQASFNHDETAVLTVADDALLWTIDFDRLVQLGKQQAIRELSDVERQQFFLPARLSE